MSLNYATVLIGISQIPTNEEYFIIKDFLKNEYKDFSGEEILIAFQKLSSGKISVDGEHYGKLSSSYLGKVLAAYRVYRNKITYEEQKQEEKNKMITEPTKEEKLETRKLFLENCFIKPYKKLIANGNNTFEAGNSVYFFWHLYQRKLLVPSPEESEKYRAKATKIIESEKRIIAKDKNELTRIVENLKSGNVEEMEKDIRVKIKEKAAELFFLDWCKAFANCDVDIEDFLQENGFYEI